MPDAEREFARASIWGTRLAAAAIPLSTALAQIGVVGVAGSAWGAAVFRRRHASAPAARAGIFDADKTAWLLVAAIGVWFVLGLLSAATHGHVPRFSHLNKALMAVGLVAGALYVRRVDPAELRVLAWLLVTGGAIAGLAGLAQIIWGAFPGESLLATRDRGWMGQLYLPGTMERVAAGTLRNRMKMAEAWLLVAAALSAATFHARGHLARVGAALGLNGVAALLYLTAVKAAFVIALVALVALILLEKSSWLRRLLPYALVAVFLAGLGTVLAIAITAPPGPAPVGAGSLAARRWIWSRAWQYFGEAPFFGIGLGTYSRVVLGDLGEGFRALTNNAHCQHLTALVEGGIFGFAAWLAVCAAIGSLLVRAWLSGAAPAAASRAVRHAATFFVLSLFAMSFVHDVLFHPNTAALFWAAVGTLLLPPQEASS